LGRPPTSEESARWTAAVHEFAAGHQIADKDVMGSLVVWRDVAHALYNTKEFIYVR
jgi:hypothetical protein